MTALLYCDGGVIGPNPSRLGGTWAWCLVAGEDIIRHGSGVLTPEDWGGPVTNNATEAVAALMALESMPPGWKGVLHTDSLVTLRRLQTHPPRKLEPIIRNRVLALRRRGGWGVALVAGHPTRLELKNGRRERNGLPTSKWNCWCDEECTRLTRLFKEKLLA